MFRGFDELKVNTLWLMGVPRKRTETYKGGEGSKIDEIERTCFLNGAL